MNKENELLGRVQKFLNYHSDVARTLPVVACTTFNCLREDINEHFASLPDPAEDEPELVAKVAKKKASKKK